MTFGPHSCLRLTEQLQILINVVIVLLVHSWVLNIGYMPLFKWPFQLVCSTYLDTLVINSSRLGMVAYLWNSRRLSWWNIRIPCSLCRCQRWWWVLIHGAEDIHRPLLQLWALFLFMLCTSKHVDHHNSPSWFRSVSSLRLFWSWKSQLLVPCAF